MADNLERIATEDVGAEPELGVFPCTCHHFTPTDNAVFWRWQDEFEFVTFLEGDMNYFAAGQDFFAHKGDAAFVNVDVPRSASSVDHNACAHGSLIVDPIFLYGTHDSALRAKYLSVFEHPCSPHVIFFRHDGDEWEREVTRLINEAWEAVSGERDFFEETVRHNLTMALLTISQHLKSGKIHRGTSPRKKILDRLKKMISFIEEHYAEDINLLQIAEAGDVSIREAQRVFQRVVNERPMNYLAIYRLTKAAELVQTTDYKMGEIAALCGFNSQSYFTKCFHSHYGLRPGAYRRVDLAKRTGSANDHTY